MGKRNPFDVSAGDEETGGKDVMGGMYGNPSAVPVPAGRLVAAPKSIKQIWPDLRQPRRAIPLSVRGRWSGDPDELADVLKHWQVMAEKESGKKIDVLKALKGDASLAVEDGDGVIYAGFAKLAGLASAILNEGLTNPITIIPNGSMWQIETGERRWLAHHLLALHIDPEKFAVIPAREVKYDPFRQASENNARDGYNAIEMARQIALLIMDARGKQDGVSYDAFEDMVYAGECDRRFYAQVANGYIHKIPDGLGDKICNATGLSLKRISHYRALLAPTEDDALNDQIWIDADANGWTENYIRETVLPSLKPPKASSTAVEHDTSTAVEVPPAGDGEMMPDKQDYAGQSGTPETKPFTPNRDAFGQDRKPMGSSPFNPSPPQTTPPLTPPRIQGGEQNSESLQGREVRLKDGRAGTIWEDKGGPKVMFLKKGGMTSSEVFRTAILEVLPLRKTAETTQEEGEPNDLSWMIGKKIRHSDPMHEGQEFEVWQAHNRQQIVNVKDERGVGFTFSAKDVTVIETPSQKVNPVKPNGKLIEDRTIYTVLIQAREMAGTLGDSEAEKSLNVLAGVTLGEIRKMAAAHDAEELHGILSLHYDAVAALMSKLMEEVETALQAWAKVDKAERNGE